MYDCPVTDGHPIANPAQFLWRGMDNNCFLNGRSRPNLNRAIVTPEDSAMTDIAIIANSNISNDDGCFAYICVLAKDRPLSGKFVEHLKPPFPAQTRPNNLVRQI